MRDGFIKQEIPFDAALVSLDLAAVYLKQDRIHELKRLAAEMLAVFQSLVIHPEALAAYTLFSEAVRRERVSFRFILDLAEFFKKTAARSKETSAACAREARACRRGLL